MIETDEVRIQMMEDDAREGTFEFLEEIADGLVTEIQLERDDRRRLKRILRNPIRRRILYSRIRSEVGDRALGDGTLLEIIIKFLQDGGAEIIINLIKSIVSIFGGI